MKCADDKWIRNEVCNDCLDECLPNEEEKKKEKEKIITAVFHGQLYSTLTEYLVDIS